MSFKSTASQDHTGDETPTFTNRHDRISLGLVLFWECTYAEASLTVAGCREVRMSLGRD